MVRLANPWTPVQRRLERRRPAPGAPPWNHNVAHHPVVLDALPHPCRRVLDVGCGQGHLLVDLAPHAERVVGIEPDGPTATAATRRVDALANVEVRRLEVFDPSLEPGSFDAVVAVASVHHLPPDTGLARLADLTRPGGRLIVIGLGRATRPAEVVRWGLGFLPANYLVWRRGHTPVDAPIHDEIPTMAEVRRQAATMTPGAVIAIHWLFRYSLVWTRPS